MRDIGVQIFRQHSLKQKELILCPQNHLNLP